MPVTDIQQLRKLHEKYSSILSYIALLNAEIARRSARLEELRKKEEKKEPQNDRLDGLNFQCFIINEGERNDVFTAPPENAQEISHRMDDNHHGF